MRSLKAVAAALAVTAALTLVAVGTAAPADASVSCSYHTDPSKYFTYLGVKMEGFEYAGHYSGITVQPSTTQVTSAGEEAQCLLKLGGYNVGTVDGVFGPKSQAAMKAFQTNMRDDVGADIAVDGMVGPQSWPWLRWDMQGR